MSCIICQIPIKERILSLRKRDRLVIIASESLQRINLDMDAKSISLLTGVATRGFVPHNPAADHGVAAMDF